jgi:hypothetical protein
MIKRIEDNHRIYGLIIVKTAKKSLVLDYGLSNVIFETTNHVFTHLHSFKFLNINLSSIELQIKMFGFKDGLLVAS